MRPNFTKQIVANAKALAKGLVDRGQTLVTGGTDNHLMVLDLRPVGLKGRQVQSAFDEVGIDVGKLGRREVFPLRRKVELGHRYALTLRTREYAAGY